MAGLMERPNNNAASQGDATVLNTTTVLSDATLQSNATAEGQAAERMFSTRSPQRPQRTPTFYVEIDGRRLEAFEGQTILEVCRANGIEVPTLCYDPKLPGFGACRMCVVDVEGCDAPLISCSAAAEPAAVIRD